MPSSSSARPHLRRKLPARQLFGHRPVVVIALESPVLIAIHCPWNSPAFHHMAQCSQISRAVFRLGLKARRRHLSGRIVDPADDGQHRPAAFQPVVPAGVGEHHHAFLRTSLSARPILRRPPLLWRPNLRLAQDPPHARPAQSDSFGCGELLLQVRVVEPYVLSAGQFHYLLPHFLRGGIDW